jgi:hypothetical protein
MNSSRAESTQPLYLHASHIRFIPESTFIAAVTGLPLLFLLKPVLEVQAIKMLDNYI